MSLALLEHLWSLDEKKKSHENWQGVIKKSSFFTDFELGKKMGKGQKNTK